MYPIAQVCFQNRQKKIFQFSKMFVSDINIIKIERKCFVYSIESGKKNRVSNNRKAQIDVEE